MGSKRSSSKNATNVSSPPPHADAPADGNHQNPKNPSIASPSKPRKKPKLSAPVSTDPSFLSHPPTDGEAPSQNNSRKGKAPEVSNKILTSDGAASRSSLFRWAETDILKLLKAVVAFRWKNGCLPTPSHMTGFLTEIKDWAPDHLSEKHFNSKLRHLRSKFHRSPKPGSESSEFDRSFHELASKVWEHERKGNGTVKKENVSKKQKGGNKKAHGEKKDVDGLEEEERDSESDKDTDEKAEKNMEAKNGEEHEKDELLVGDNCLLEAKGAEYPYKYLRLALEEYWAEAKLNMDTLYAALPKVDHAQAKPLDERFHEVFVGMLKLKMEKNKVSNEIIRAALGC